MGETGCYTCTQECHRKEVKTKNMRELTYHFKQDNELWKSDKIKEKGFGNLGTVKNIWRKLMKNKGYFTKVCLCRLKSVLSPE